jgi:putative lipoic acid-binding regulatory protein
MSENVQLLEFPCEFPIKVMGRASDAFRAEVTEVLARHVPDEDQAGLTTQGSSAGRFVSITLTIRARSREQIDHLYKELNGLESVLMTL